MEFKINLETQPFCCEHSLTADILNTLEYINKNKKGKFSSVVVLAYGDTIERLFKTLCSINFDDSDAELSFNMLDYDYTDYENEYALIITLEDCYTREFTISIEKAIHKDGTYNLYDEDYLYVDEACSDELVKKHLQFENTMDVFCIDEDYEEEFEDDECDGDCENCELNEYESDEFEKGKDFYEFVYEIVDEILDEKFNKK